ncbi:zinc-ribbon domain-containing protein [bacterium]|nr:zinc-ribbon domain-containing protein [bacterium]
MIIICHKCDSRFKVRDDMLTGGPKKARCKNCGAQMLISLPDSGVVPPEGLLTSAIGPEPASPAVAPAADTPQPAAPAASSPGAQETPAAEGQADAAEASSTIENSTENAMAKLEKRRREMEDEIAGRLHKAALETLEFQDLEYLGNKLKAIESNPEAALEEDIQLFACIKCKSVFALYADDPRQCPNCPADSVLVRGQDILRQFGMFNR